MPDRPMTTSELAMRLADFEGDEPVHYGDMGEVCSATLIETPWGRTVVLSEQPPRGEGPEPRRWWREVVEAVKGLAGARVTRGPLGHSREDS